MLAPALVAIGLILAFTALTIALQKGSRTRTLDKSPDDRKSAMWLGMAHTACLAVAIVAVTVRPAPLSWPVAIAWAADGVMVLGFLLQVWAIRALAGWFTLSLGTHAEQPLIDRGPYRRIRHPGYLAQLVYWLAFAVAMRDLVALAVVAGTVLPAYAWRIHVEEKMLAQTFGDRFGEYTRRTRRLVPFLY